MDSKWLPDFILPTRANLIEDFSGIDSQTHCLDKDHFDQYPHKIEYRYNSRGYRDAEWPDDLDSLQSAIWCIGDSFTVGIGQPIEHTWPQVLSVMSKRRTINISMDGASNDWIARKALQIANDIKPHDMVIMWSYLHRREIPDASLSDENRRSHHDWQRTATVADDFANFAACKRLIGQARGQIIHTIIPKHRTDIQDIWDDVKGPDWPKTAPVSKDQFDRLPKIILHELQHRHRVFDALCCHFDHLHLFNDVEIIPYLDVARDGYHFDILTSRYVVARVQKFLT